MNPMLATFLAMLAFAAALPPARAMSEGQRTVIEGEVSAARRCYAAAADGRTDDDAVALCTRAIEDAEERGHKHNRTASTVNRGVVRYNRGEYPMAVDDFGTAIDVHGTKLARVLVNRGLSHEASAPGDARAEALARADYELALQRSPNNEEAARRLRELDKPFLERRPVGRTLVAGGAPARPLTSGAPLTPGAPGA